MENINVSVPKNNTLQAQLVALYYTFSRIKEGEKCHFDLSQLNWIHPLLILPIASYIKDTQSTFISPKNTDTNLYLETIKFPVGVTSVNELQKTKSFIPISLLSKTIDIRNRALLESCFEELLYKAIGETHGTKDALFLPYYRISSQHLPT